jgi:N4-(beta-N-acetylglucosaminyl)-L-asparaginase
MTSRREFLQSSLLATGALALPRTMLSGDTAAGGAPGAPGARVVSTWDFGVGANAAAWPVLAWGGSALDAIEDIEHPVSVARAVMEKTPHVLLVAEGAQQFAVSQGFEKKPLLTDEARKAWREWLKKSEYEPKMNVERSGRPGDEHDHDTLGILALDAHGKLAGACTTSGMAWKLHGRVGDSPIIGAGLYVDNEVGAATASGVGEEMIRNAASFLVVELMRQGRSPTDACREAIERVVHKRPAASKTLQVCFLAIDRDGEVGAYALHPGFVYAVHDGTPGPHDKLIGAASVYSSKGE